MAKVVLNLEVPMVQADEMIRHLRHVISAHRGRRKPLVIAAASRAIHATMAARIAVQDLQKAMRAAE